MPNTGSALPALSDAALRETLDLMGQVVANMAGKLDRHDLILARMQSTAQESRPFDPARSAAPKAPTPEASVGVAMPKKMLPRTARIRPAAGKVARRTSNKALRSSGKGCAGRGAAWGLNWAYRMMYTV